MRIVIIGAGVTGLTVAGRLSAAGLRPLVIDKGRGIGGRLATRRAGALRFDHGTPALPWQPPLAALPAARLWKPPGTEAPWLVGAPGMSALAHDLARDLDIRSGAEVEHAAHDGRWTLHLSTGDRLDGIATLVSTVPAPQAAQLFPETASDIAGVSMEPCWTLMAAFDGVLDLPDAVSTGGAAARLIRESAKPDRDATPERWVVHTAPDWAEAHLDLPRDEALPRLLALLSERAGPLPPQTHAAAHRWRYARTVRPMGAPFLRGPDLYLGGDWALGPGVANALASGNAIADDIL